MNLNDQPEVRFINLANSIDGNTVFSGSVDARKIQLRKHDPFPAAPVHFHRVEDSFVVMRSIATPKKVI